MGEDYLQGKQKRRFERDQFRVISPSPLFSLPCIHSDKLRSRRLIVHRASASLAGNARADLPNGAQSSFFQQNRLELLTEFVLSLDSGEARDAEKI